VRSQPDRPALRLPLIGVGVALAAILAVAIWWLLPGRSTPLVAGAAVAASAPSSTVAPDGALLPAASSAADQTAVGAASGAGTAGDASAGLVTDASRVGSTLAASVARPASSRPAEVRPGAEARRQRDAIARAGSVAVNPLLPPAADHGDPGTAGHNAVALPPSAPASVSPGTALTTLPAAAAADPNTVCGRRILLAYHRCMLRECEKPEFAGHSECARVKAIEDRQRNSITQ
jgi:hypothetical protein